MIIEKAKFSKEHKVIFEKRMDCSELKNASISNSSN